MSFHCKCHGLSGSCELQTCWTKLPNFREITVRLQQKYDEALRITSSNNGKSMLRNQQIDSEDLIYYEDSPDYCVPSKRKGSLGTVGRICDPVASDSSSCKSLCCGRGYKEERVVQIQKCQCRFYWCCHVKCQMCHLNVIRHICL